MLSYTHTVPRLLLGILLPFVLFAPLLSIDAEEQPDVRIFENPGAEEQPVSGRFVPLEKFEGSAKLCNAYASEGLSDFLNKLFLGAVSPRAITGGFCAPLGGGGKKGE